VLAIAAAFEGTSLRIAYREYRPWTAHPPVGLHHRIEDPALFSVILEDSVALIGICFAAADPIAASLFHIT
jgi:hypothetical protein